MIIQSDYTYRCVLTEPSRGEDRGVLVSDDAFPSRFFLFAPRASFVLFRADPDVARLLARYRRLDWNGTPSPERNRIGLTRLWAARPPGRVCSASSGKRALRRTGREHRQRGMASATRRIAAGRAERRQNRAGRSPSDDDGSKSERERRLSSLDTSSTVVYSRSARRQRLRPRDERHSAVSALRRAPPLLYSVHVRHPHQSYPPSLHI